MILFIKLPKIPINFLNFCQKRISLLKLTPDLWLRDRIFPSSIFQYGNTFPALFFRNLNTESWLRHFWSLTSWIFLFCEWSRRVWSKIYIYGPLTILTFHFGIHIILGLLLSPLHCFLATSPIVSPFLTNRRACSVIVPTDKNHRLVGSIGATLKLWLNCIWSAMSVPLLSIHNLHSLSAWSNRPH